MLYYKSCIVIYMKHALHVRYTDNKIFAIWNYADKKCNFFIASSFAQFEFLFEKRMYLYIYLYVLIYMTKQREKSIAKISDKWYLFKEV